jgi:5-oxoprolinase (ATP-hydrolysing) subunit A
MARPILLNIDLGELPDEPEALYACAAIANVACGGHAGDDASMRRAVAACRAHGVRVGAHPSYPDREGFGRRRFAMRPSALRQTVVEQCARLRAVAEAEGMPVAYVKAHGALYHAAGDDPDVAEALVEGAREALGTVVVIGAAQGALVAASARAGHGYAREAFADRGIADDGSLIPRGQPGALVVDPTLAAARARSLAARSDVDTVCVHGDTPGAVDIARAVRRALDEST